jgi:hypothetical protein
LGVRPLVEFALARHRIPNVRRVLERDVRAVVGDCLCEQPIRHSVQVVTIVPFFAVVTLDERAMSGLGARFLEATANTLELAVFVQEFLP